MQFRQLSVALMAIVALGAVTAQAQDSTRARARSQQRIRISKEGGEVVSTTRVDTVTVFKTDTIRLNGRIDTVTSTVTRYDTMRVETAAPIMTYRLPLGLYFGLAGGASHPDGALFTPNSTGLSAQAQLGWQSSVVGLRVDANYAQPGEDSQFSNMAGDPDILNFNGDLKLALPFMNAMLGRRFAFYAVGGVSHIMFKNLPMRMEGTNPDGSLIFTAPDPNWQHQWGWNAGPGASLQLGRAELFLEGRMIAFDASNTPQARQFPVVLGFNWY
jgi:hypothetical protein